MKRLNIKKRIFEEKNKIYHEHKICVLTFVILLSIWLIISFYMKYAPFGKNSLLLNDAIHQYYPLFGQYRDRLLKGTGIFYSAGGGMGFNFYALWTYYLSSPLNLLLIFCPASQIEAAMNLLIIFKVIISGTTFAWYLEKRNNKNNYGIIPFACGYALSTFILGYCYNIMWLDCIALFPLILAGMEQIVEEGKCKLYIISLALSLWCSFYISFMICIFLVLWYLFYEHKSIKNFFTRGFLFGGCSLLSAGLASVVLLPAYIGIVQTQSKSKLPDFEWMGSFADIFAGKEGGIFAFSNPLSLNNELSYNANLYAGVFVLGLLILYFFAKDISKLQKIKMGWLVIMFLLSLNNQFLNYVWHGFHYQVGIPNRFVFLLIFLVLVMSFEAFEHLQSYEPWKICIAGIVPIILCSVLYYLKKENITLKMFVLTLLFIMIYMILEVFYNKEDKSSMFRKILIVCMCLEVFVNAIAGSKMQGGVYAESFYRKPNDVQKMADSIPYDQYRTELSNATVKNEGLAYNLRGTGIFSSMANPSTITLLHNIGFSTSSNAYAIAGSTPVLNTLFGIKNYLIIDKDANRLDYEYQKSKTIGDVNAYTKDKVLPIAYLCENSIQNWSSMKSNFFDNQQELLRLMTGKEYEVYTEQPYQLIETNDIQVESLDESQQFTYLSAKGNRNDHAVFEAVADTDEDIYLRLQARYANKITVLVNDEVIAFKDLSSSFYHVGKVKEGDRITVKVGILENSPTYGMISMSMYAYHSDIMEEVYQNLKSGALNVTEWEEGFVKGNVEVKDTKQTLFTSIPYEKGWNVYVDGEKKKTQTIHNGFLMVELAKGEHEIEFVYKVPGLKEGILISIGSLFVLTILFYIQRKRVYRHNKQLEEVGDTSNESQ